VAKSDIKTQGLIGARKWLLREMASGEKQNARLAFVKSK
jgi:hypothetical protein